MPQHSVPDIIKLKPGGTTRFAVAPGNAISRMSVGPFRAGETPEFETKTVPADPLVLLQTALDYPNGFVVVFIMQNYGQRTVRVRIRRLR